MKLSMLAYLVVKNVNYFDDPNFQYEAFRDGEYNDDPDYSNAINNFFTPLNEAIHRLSDRRKIASCIEPVGNLVDGCILSIANIKQKIKKILNVFYLTQGEFKRVGFREFTKGKIYVLCSNGIPKKPFYVQFYEDIPNFTSNDIYYETETDENYHKVVIQDNDVELNDYGINESMTSYIIEYCQGKLQENIDFGVASTHLNNAERYFEDLEEPETKFNQTVIGRKYGINE